MNYLLGAGSEDVCGVVDYECFLTHSRSTVADREASVARGACYSPDQVETNWYDSNFPNCPKVVSQVTSVDFCLNETLRNCYINKFFMNEQDVAYMDSMCQLNAILPSAYCEQQELVDSDFSAFIPSVGYNCASDIGSDFGLQASEVPLDICENIPSGEFCGYQICFFNEGYSFSDVRFYNLELECDFPISDTCFDLEDFLKENCLSGPTSALYEECSKKLQSAVFEFGCSLPDIDALYPEQK